MKYKRVDTTNQSHINTIVSLESCQSSQSCWVNYNISPEKFGVGMIPRNLCMIPMRSQREDAIIYPETVVYPTNLQSYSILVAIVHHFWLYQSYSKKLIPTIDPTNCRYRLIPQKPNLYKPKHDNRLFLTPTTRGTCSNATSPN
jgi:hypothetical protein